MTTTKKSVNNLEKNLELLNKRKEANKIKKEEMELEKDKIFIQKFKNSFDKKEYLRDNYFKNLGMLLFLTLTLISSCIYAYYSFFVYEPPAKFLVLDSDGRVLEEKPLNQDLYPDEKLTQWANDSLKNLFTYNHISFPTHGSKQQNIFTNNGYKDFMGAFNELRLQKKVKEQQGIIEPILVKPLKIASVGSVAGNTRKAWKMDGVMVLNLHGKNGREAFKYNVSLLLIRTTFKENKNGVAIEKVQLIN